MNMDSKQKTQLVILCCLVAAVIAFGAYRVIGKGTQAASETPKQTQTASSKTTDSPEADAVVQEDMQLVAMAGVTMGDSRDPFIAQIGPKTGGRTASAPPPPSGPRPPSLFEQDPGGLPFGIEPIDVNPGNGGSAIAQPQTDPASQLSLTGVIEGEVNVAIIRSGDKTRYIVREGQVIDGRYTVESIARVGVRLRHGDKSLILRLGSGGAS